MPTNPPLAASGSRELKRPRPIPRTVRDAIALMVYGALDDPDCKPLDFVEAAKFAGIKVDVMRRYLDRGDVRALLRSERRAFREAICAGNEGALKRVRDTSANGMSVVAAVRGLEQLDADEVTRSPSAATPGVTIRVVTVVQQPPAEPLSTAQTLTIEHEHEREREPPDNRTPRRDAKGDPIFEPRR